MERLAMSPAARDASRVRHVLVAAEAAGGVGGAGGAGRAGGAGGRAARRGFTLIEVMIVILIVLALGGVVGYALLGTRDKAEQDIGRVQLDQFKSALKMFRVAHGRYPTDDEGLRVLWDKGALADENDARNWTALMDQPLPNDRWGTPWGYRQKSEHGDETMYDLWSFGPDKQEGTSDDITSWDAKATPGDADGGGSEPAPTGS